jgi:hypothetical protein
LDPKHFKQIITRTDKEKPHFSRSVKNLIQPYKNKNHIRDDLSWNIKRTPTRENPHHNHPNLAINHYQKETKKPHIRYILIQQIAQNRNQAGKPTIFVVDELNNKETILINPDKTTKRTNT